MCVATLAPFKQYALYTELWEITKLFIYLSVYLPIYLSIYGIWNVWMSF